MIYRLLVGACLLLVGVSGQGFRQTARSSSLGLGGGLTQQQQTTPVPILVDSRRIDLQTGAFVYEYAGGDGSSKFEFRFPNGTVIGNYSFVNELGQLETRQYSAGVQDSSHDETLDPNYVDLGNYDHYRHLEEPYVHNEGRSTSSQRGRLFEAAQPRQPVHQPRAPAVQSFQAPAQPQIHQPVQTVHHQPRAQRVHHQPVQRQPVQRQPVQRQPVQRQPVQHQPIQRQPVQHQPIQPVHRQPVQPVHHQSFQPVHQQAAQPVHQQAAQPVHQQAAQPFHHQPIQTVHHQPVQPVHHQPVQPVHRQPVQPVHRQPVQPVHLQPAQQIQSFHQPAPQPIHHRPATRPVQHRPVITQTHPAPAARHVAHNPAPLHVAPNPIRIAPNPIRPSRPAHHVPSLPSVSVPLSFNTQPASQSHFSQAPVVAPTFNLNTVTNRAPVHAPAPRPAPVHQSLAPARHRLNLAPQQRQNQGDFLDSVIRQFQ